jgi:UDP-N-acetylglucosamine 2-epimerase (non-hydrolysing)
LSFSRYQRSSERLATAKPLPNVFPQVIKLLVVAGARPNFMKIAPLLKAAQANGSSPRNARFEYRLVHTGQHYDTGMSDVFFAELGIPAPDINLGVGSGSHAVQTANIMSRFDAIFERERPDWVVVVGDVNSTLACTLVCAKRGIKVVHVEAGLRSFDRSMPEEVNRIVTDALSNLLLTPSEDANQNLENEGIDKSKIKLVGNIMIDSIVQNLDKARQGAALGNYGLQDRQFVYVTLHRPSNVDQEESLTQIMAELKRLATRLIVVFPMHPRTRKMLSEFKISDAVSSRIKLTDPIAYRESLCLTEQARFVLTDSGGLQEESTFFRTPCLTLRPNTERPITVSLGSNKLTSLARLRSDIDDVLAGPDRLGTLPPLWDGQTARRCVECIQNAHA